MLCINTSFIYVIYSNVACSSRTTLTPLPSELPLPGKLCHLHNLLGEQGRAGGMAGGTGERFILKQFKIFSCNYMSTSRKSRQDNDKDNGENRARSRATAANTSTNINTEIRIQIRIQTQMQMANTNTMDRRLCIWIYSSIAADICILRALNSAQNTEKNYVTLRYWCLDFCILYNGAYDYFKFARAKYCAYAALAKRQCETGQV